MATITTKTYGAGGMGPPRRLEEQIDDLIEKANGRARDLVIKTINKINAELIKNTPYVTGTLRASWYAQINIAPAPVSSERPGALMAGAVGSLDAVAEGLKLGDVYYVSNGANYAGYVEYGTVKMAPRAYTRRTLQQAREFAEEAAAEISAT
jgi:HK97 gp10 family phage protein